MATRQHPGPAAWWERVLRGLVVATALGVMLLFLVTACLRVRYPYELEELEGYVFLAALRVAHGQPLYPQPSLAFVPYMYPPAYFYAAAALGRVLGMSIATMRAVSILSTLGSFAVIAGLVWREPGLTLPRGQLAATWRWLPPLAAAGLYAGCYTLSGAWFDLGRLDALFVLLILLALAATRYSHPVVAALLWALVFQTKQTILPVAFVMLCWRWRDRRRTLVGVGTLALAAGASVVWLNHATGGWYGFTVFRIPAANADLKLRALALFWPQDVLRPLGLALAAIAAAVVLTRSRSLWRAIEGNDSARFYTAACSLLPLCWWVRGHAGSAANALMPVYALVAILFGLALSRLLAWTLTLPPLFAQRATLLVLAAALAQELAGLYNPRDYRPSPAAQAAVAAAVADIRALPGEVVVLQHPYYAWLAGKPVAADLVSLRDASRVHSPVAATLQSTLQSALQSELPPALQSALPPRALQRPPTALILDAPASLADLEKLLGPDVSWTNRYPVQQQLPGVPQGTRPDWLLRR